MRKRTATRWNVIPTATGVGRVPKWRVEGLAPDGAPFSVTLADETVVRQMAAAPTMLAWLKQYVRNAECTCHDLGGDCLCDACEAKGIIARVDGPARPTPRRRTMAHMTPERRQRIDSIRADLRTMSGGECREIGNCLVQRVDGGYKVSRTAPIRRTARAYSEEAAATAIAER